MAAPGRRRELGEETGEITWVEVCSVAHDEQGAGGGRGGGGRCGREGYSGDGKNTKSPNGRIADRETEVLRGAMETRSRHVDGRGRRAGGDI